MADNVTFMEVPPNVDDPLILRRFLLQLLENLDIAFGNRGQQGFIGSSEAAGISNAVSAQTFAGQVFDNIKRYSEEFNLQNDRDIIDVGFLNENSSNNEEQSAITDTSYIKANPSVGYVQSEAITVDDGVDNNASKINEILTALRNADIIEV